MSGDGLIDIPHKILEEAMRTGVNVREDDTSGVFFHVDQSTIYSKVGQAYADQIRADGFAPDAAAAVKLAERLLA